MTGEFEPVSGWIRVWADGRHFPDPFEWTAGVRFIERDTIEICAVDKPVTPGIWRAVVEECRRIGVRTILFKRIKDGEKQTKVVEVKDG